MKGALTVSIASFFSKLQYLISIFTLFYFILFYFILFYFILFYSILFYFILFYLILFSNGNIIGIGLESKRVLAKAGANVFMACRDITKVYLHTIYLKNYKKKKKKILQKQIKNKKKKKDWKMNQ